LRRSDYLDGLRSAYPGEVAGIAFENFGRASLAGLDAPAEPLRAAVVAAEIHLAAQG